MRKKLLALVCLPALVGGCGQASEAASREYDEQFRANCISASSRGDLAAELATQACDCALRRINETYGMSEKLTLTDEQVQPIALECLAEVTQANG